MARAFSASIWIGLERLEVNVRVAEVVRGHGGPLPKSLDSDKNFKPEHTLFCRNIKICRDLRTFWKSLDKKVPFLVKNSASLARSALLHCI